MNLIQKALVWLGNIPVAERTTAYPIDANLITRDKIVAELVKKNRTLEAQAAKRNAQDKIGLASEEKKKIEDEMKASLQEQQLDMKSKKYKGNFDFAKFYKQWFSDAKFRDKLEIVDRTDTKVLAKFGNFKMIGDKFAILSDKGVVMSIGSKPQHVIFKPESLANQLRRGRITIPYDTEGNYVPDFEAELMPEVYYDETEKKWEFSNQARKPFLKIMIDKENQIMGLSSEIERIELINVSQSRQIADLKRALGSQKIVADVSSSELSKTLQMHNDGIVSFADYSSRLASIQQQANMSEKSLASAMNIIEELRSKLEGETSSPQAAKALDKVKELILFAKDNTPRVINQTIIPKNEPTPPPKRGEVLNNNPAE